MKRRTIDASKLRRPAKRSRIADSVNGSWLLYIRFFIVWLVIITMDFALEFRFEFLWPFWLLIRSTFDSFRCQGIGLTLFFLCITLLSDVICFMFLPVHWLFFVASTYVWVQFVITTERGPCIATISLWLLFVYVEASVRLREIKSIPFHLDICRPFAAHCIGYPVVSLGYGFKSYLGYKVKSYRKMEVGKQNDFYQQLVSYALPVEIQNIYGDLLESKKLIIENGINSKSDIETIISSETRKRGLKITNIDEKQANSSLSLNDLETISSIPVKEVSSRKNGSTAFDALEGLVKVAKGSNSYNNIKANGDLNNSHSSGSTTMTKRSRNKPKQPESDYELDISDSEDSMSSSRISQDSSPKSNHTNKNDHNCQSKLKDEQTLRRKAEQQISQLECEIKRLRSEVHCVRETEVEFRTQVNASLIAERYLKAEVEQLTSDNENLQQKISSFTSSKSQDKVLISSLERKLKSERDNRASLETQLKESKKKTSNDTPLPTRRVENHDSCNARTSELEMELSKLQSRFEEATQTVTNLKKENFEKAKQKNTELDCDKMKKDLEFLTNALNVMQGKNLHLESSLSSETRLKLDLFSALGDTRRQLEIVQGQMKAKCAEVDILKGRIAEVMAVMPPQYHSSIRSYGAGGLSESNGGFLTNQNGQDHHTAAVTIAGYSPSIPQNGVA